MDGSWPPKINPEPNGYIELRFYWSTPYQNGTHSVDIWTVRTDDDFTGIIEAVKAKGGIYCFRDNGTVWWRPWPPSAVEISLYNAEGQAVPIHKPPPRGT